MLVMKALSLGLVKGSIDQVDAKVHMTWVQPRVLDREQVRLNVVNAGMNDLHDLLLYCNPTALSAYV